MTDNAGDNKPFPGFPGFPPAEMLDKMWDMMRLTPFGAAFPGSGQGLSSPLTAMSDMMTPLMSVEELDKRITDMRAVEQWLKLNLNMLQSATQALEVQRATLSTLRAFGAFAQASMTQPAQGETKTQDAEPLSAFWGAKPAERAAPEQPASAKPAGAAEAANEGANEQGANQAGPMPGAAAFDPSAWWNLLQSQFNQLASFATAQQPGAGASGGAASESNDAKATKGGTEGPSAPAGKHATSSTGSVSAKPAAKRPAARKSGGKPAG